ncbi:hypothetical protein Vafri_4065, partial [Volvox africanus]
MGGRSPGGSNVYEDPCYPLPGYTCLGAGGRFAPFPFAFLPVSSRAKKGSRQTHTPFLAPEMPNGSLVLPKPPLPSPWVDGHTHWSSSYPLQPPTLYLRQVSQAARMPPSGDQARSAASEVCNWKCEASDQVDALAVRQRPNRHPQPELRHHQHAGAVRTPPHSRHPCRPLVYLAAPFRTLHR